METPGNNRFDLEPLESRFLLSGIDVLAAADGLHEQAECTDEVSVSNQTLPAGQSHDAIEYDPATQVNDMFEGAAALPTTETTKTSSVGATSATPTQSSSGSGNFISATGSSQVSGSPLTEQLTTTLTAANGPPAATGSIPYTGLKLNGVPLNDSNSGNSASDSYVLGAGNILSGSGAFNADVVVGGTISPGNSPGLLQTGSQNWLANGFPYDWEINDVSGGEGNNPGWDFQRINGTLNIVATTANPATIRVKSLQLNNSPGNVFNFNSANAYTWRILSTTGGITGFNRSAILLNATNFTNSLGSGALFLDISADGRDLLVRFVPTLPYLSLNQPVWTSQGPGTMSGNDNSILPSENPASGAAQALVLHPANSSIAWMGSVNGGLWMTTNFHYSTTNGLDDNGVGGIDDAAETPTWTPLAQNLPSLGITAIAVSPFDAANNAVTFSTPLNQIVLYLATGQFSSAGEGGAAAGVFRSMDGGATWTEIGDFSDLRVTAIVPHAQTAGLVYVATYDIFPPQVPLLPRGGVYRSFDRGNTWDRLSGFNGLPNYRVTDLVQDTSTAGRFYVALAGNPEGLNNTDVGVYRTDTGDQPTVNWVKVVNGINPDYNHDTVRSNTELLDYALRIRLAVSPTGNTVYAGVIGWYNGTKATDGGLAGVFRSTNLGVNWTALGTEPQTHTLGQGYFHFGMAADSNTVYIAGDASALSPYDGIVYRWDAGTWTRISAEQLIDPGIYKTAPHSDIRNLVFDSFNNGLVALTDGGAYRLHNPVLNGGVKWEFIARGVSVAEISSIVYDRNTNTLSAGTQDNGVLTQLSPNSPDWYGVVGGDGNTVGVAYYNPFASGNSMRFYLGNNFHDFYRLTYNSSNVLQSTTQLLLRYPGFNLNFSGLDSTFGSEGDSDEEFEGFQQLPFAVNAVDDLNDGNIRLLLGRIGLYVSNDNGDHLEMLPGWERILETAGADAYVTAVAYGGIL